MASLIPGYEYDIFISYRQKDNKGDRWVSEFVEALKTELESTFKEEISVYFDINPCDGLLETHDVEASLKDKLKCLVFIPIISRTYCDPKSYAWEHEIKAFVEEASKDQFGLKVRLPNGNVANRVLPVRIHDLDTEDIKLCESVLGAVLRGVEFVYKEPGVNRPLNPSDDEKKNLNRTKYRNQVNKVANAIKEIITALGQYEQKSEAVQKELPEPVSVIRKGNKTKIIAGSIIVLVLLFLGISFLPKLFKSSKPIGKSIAILPFRNDSPDKENVYFIDGTMEAILDNLCKIKDLKVISRTSAEQYRNTTKSIPQIAKELNVSYILEGSGQKYGDDIKLTVQLLDAVNDKHIWSNPYNRKIKDIYTIQSEIAQAIATELKAIITPEEKQRIEKPPTENLEAYNLYLLGKFLINQNLEESLKKGIKCFKNAIQLDSTFALAYIGLSQCYQFMVRYSWMSRDEGYPEAKKAVLKAIEIDESPGEAHSTLGLIMIVFDWDIYGPEQEFQKAIKLSPNSSEIYSSFAQYLRWIGRYDQGIIMAKQAIELDPQTPLTNMWLGINYLYAGYYDESINCFKKVLTLDSNYFYAYSHLAFSYTLKGLYSEAIQYADKTMSLIGSISNDPFNASYAGWVYAKSGEIIKAKEILTQVKELYRQTNGDPIHIAIIYDGLGEHEKAFEYLLKAYNVRSGQIIYLNAFSNSFFKDISSDPRYKNLLKEIGFKVI